MLTVDAAYRVLGVDPGADREEVRAAFRRRMRELHPDVSGDASPAGQATAREVIAAYRRLCEPTAGFPAPRTVAAPSPSQDLADVDRPSQSLERGPNPRLVQVAMASMLVFGASVFVVFFLVAFSQSGR